MDETVKPPDATEALTRAIEEVAGNNGKIGLARETTFMAAACGALITMAEGINQLNERLADLVQMAQERQEPRRSVPEALQSLESRIAALEPLTGEVNVMRQRVGHCYSAVVGAIDTLSEQSRLLVNVGERLTNLELPSG